MTKAAMHAEDAPKAAQAFARPSFFRGLSGKLLLLTVIFVMVAEVLIFVPSISAMRIRWLDDRLNTAAAAAIVVDGLQNIQLDGKVREDTLRTTGALAIALRHKDESRLIVADEMPPDVDAQYDVDDANPLLAIHDALDTLIFGGDRTIRVYGAIDDDNADTMIELVMPDKKLRKAMLRYARNVFVISIIISLITGIFIFVAINRMFLQPIKRMTDNMQEFAADPADPARVMAETEGRDELAMAGRHLAFMQRDLQKTLKEQKNLADLGLAVSKINHDMRNMLSSAQLISDRLSDVDDPMVKRFTPTLLRAIDRAVSYTTHVMAYGRAKENAPNRRFLKLKPLIQDVTELLAIDPQSGIELRVQVDGEIEVDADGEQLFRVVHNLARNALQALQQERGGETGIISISATRTGSVVSISVDDTGPGMPPKARENLFSAFRGSARSGGTGLGLAIARELVLAHGGTIALVEKPTRGTLFRVEIPDSPVSLDLFRSRSGA
ncbi:sensor histidine kinase [Xaviernesmea oryzae]|nr:Signal transduction histidine kinase [Xaviernesmea oryzae]